MLDGSVESVHDPSGCVARDNSNFGTIRSFPSADCGGARAVCFMGSQGQFISLPTPKYHSAGTQSVRNRSSSYPWSRSSGARSLESSRRSSKTVRGAFVTRSMETPQGVVRAERCLSSFGRADGRHAYPWLYPKEDRHLSTQTPPRPSRKRHVSLSHPPQPQNRCVEGRQPVSRRPGTWSRHRPHRHVHGHPRSALLVALPAVHAVQAFRVKPLHVRRFGHYFPQPARKFI